MKDPWGELGLLADPLRRGIFDRLLRGPSHVNGIVEGLGVTQSAVSQQLKKMKVGGLVEEQRKGKYVIYEVSAAARGRLRTELQSLYRRLDPARQIDSAKEPLDHIDAAMEIWADSWSDHEPTMMGIFTRINLISDRLRQAFSRAIQNFQLNMPEMALLSALERMGSPFEATATELSRLIFSSLPSVSKYVGSLENKNFISRRQNLHDARSNILQMTTEGRDALHGAINFARMNDLRGAYRISPEHQLMAAQATRTLLNMLNIEVPPQPEGRTVTNEGRDKPLRSCTPER